MTFNTQKLVSGGFFVALGVVYGTVALRTLSVGQTLNMGPGYFPAILASLLVILGAAILVQGFVSSVRQPLGVIPWRAILMLSLAFVGFAYSVRGLGLFPCVFLTAIVAAAASPQVRPTPALGIGLVVATFSTLVFGYGLAVPVPVVGPWLTPGG